MHAEAATLEVPPAELLETFSLLYLLHKQGIAVTAVMLGAQPSDQQKSSNLQSVEERRVLQPVLHAGQQRNSDKKDI